MKKIKSYMFKGVNYAVLVVLLAILHQTSQQNPGKKGFSALINDFYSRPILNECPQKRYVVLACICLSWYKIIALRNGDEVYGEGI